MNLLKKTENLVHGVLKTAERYVGTDVLYLAEGGFWLTLEKVIFTITSLLLAIAFANLLDPVVYGNYRYIISIVEILTIFTITGMGTAITQAAARGFEGSFYTGFNIKLRWGLLGSLFCALLTIYYWLRGNYLLSVPFLISALFLPLMQASRVYISFLTGKGLFNVQAKYLILSQIVSSLILVIVLFFKKNLLWLIGAYFISNTLLNCVFFLFTEKNLKPNRKEDKKTVSFGKHMSLIDAISIIADYMDRLVIFHFLGAWELAIYQFAISPPEQISSFLKNIYPLALAKFSKKTKSEVKNFFSGKFLKFLAFTTIITVLYIIFAPFIYRLFFPKYSESVFYSQLSAIPLIIAGGLPVGALESQMATKEKYVLSFFSGILRIALIFILVFSYGILGVVAGVILAKFFSFFLSLSLIKKLR